MKNSKTIKQLLNKPIQFLLAVLVYAVFIAFVIYRVSSANFSISKIFDYSNLLKEAFLNTIIISLYSVFFGTILGFILYILRESKIYFVKSLSNIFIEVMMGTPLLVLVFITSYFIGESFNFRDDYVLGIMAITAYIGPYMANMFKGAIDSIDPQQYLVMDLYGFTGYQKYRYIILPQIAMRMMPPLMNNLSYAIKGSSLLYVTAVTEIFYAIKLIQSKTFAFTEGYLVLWGAYLTITLTLTLITKYIESRQV
ncbi:MAG: ABC transporter permease subunit [Eubacteriales bacterium]